MADRRFVLSPIPLDAAHLRLQETLFHNANGYLGVRGALEESRSNGPSTMRGLYVNGLYEFVGMKQAEPLHGLVEEKQTMLNVAETQAIRLAVDGGSFALTNAGVSDASRTLDMTRGVTERTAVWQARNGARVRVTITRMASFTRPSLFTIDIQVTLLSLAPVEIRFVSFHEGEVCGAANPDDPRLSQERAQHLFVERVEAEAGASAMLARTKRSRVAVATFVTHAVSMRRAGEEAWTDCENASIDPPFKKGAEVTQLISAPLLPGDTLRLRKDTTVCDSLREDDPWAAAYALAMTAAAIPLETLYAEQQSALADCWARCDMTVRGDDALGSALTFNIYQLLQAVSRDAFGNVAAKGLSGEGYEGHYFWDTEMYLEPFYALTMPALCRNLIAFRVRQLPLARENARRLGHERGALYPWRTIMGRECSGYFPSGAAAYHINGDIAYSLVRYYLVTGDESLLLEGGADMLYEIARLWLDAGCFTDGGFHINAVTGPDEYTCLVNDNYYTNALAKYSLHWALKVYDLLAEKGLADTPAAPSAEERALFRRAEKEMTLLYDETLGINPQDDSFLRKKPWDIEGTPLDDFPLLLHYHPLALYRRQVCKQADTVLAHFLLPEYQREAVMRASYLYYEKITTHDSSLSTCAFSMAAARLGMRDKALAYFGDSAQLDLFNTHRNTGDGLHMANMGGCWMAVVYGFAGLRVTEEGISFDPFLPAGWEGYTFRFQYRGVTRAFAMDKDGWKVTDVEG